MLWLHVTIIEVCKFLKHYNLKFSSLNICFCVLVFVLCEHSRFTVKTENHTEFLTFKDNGFEEEMHVGEIACLLM